MGIIGRLLGGKKEAPGAAPAGEARPAWQEGVPLGMKLEKPVLTITDEAKQKIRSILEGQGDGARTIRVSAVGPGKYSMNLEQGGPQLEDSVLPYDGFEVYVDANSAKWVEGASLTWVDTYGGGGFQFSAPPVQKPPRKEAPEGPEGEIWRQIDEILQTRINPQVASHGGYIDLIEYRDGIAYVEMGGGCQGCAMSKMTLKQGVEQELKASIPEVQEVLDVTDHAGGRNPYYAGV